jgi:hypothetical protein
MLDFMSDRLACLNVELLDRGYHGLTIVEPQMDHEAASSEQ